MSKEIYMVGYQTYVDGFYAGTQEEAGIDYINIVYRNYDKAEKKVKKLNKHHDIDRFSDEYKVYKAKLK